MTFFSDWQQSLSQQILQLEQDSLLRKLSCHTGRVDFCSNDYLSLNTSGILYKLLRECVMQWQEFSVGSTASRLIRGHYTAFSDLEEVFAKQVDKKSALFFNSGYAANTGALPVILSARDMVFCDRLCHASLLDGVRLAVARRHYFRHNDLNDLEAKLKRYALARSQRSRIWIVTESIFSMDGDSHDLTTLCNLAERYDACIYLDEAHALGVRGQGKGLAQEAGIADRIAVTVFPCGKAPGLMGAFVCGPQELKILLINKARSFVFSTALPPFLADLLNRVLAVVFSVEMESARKHLQALAHQLRNSLQAAGFSTAASSSQIIPLITGTATKALQLAAACQEAGLDVRAIRPPTVPHGQSRLRLSLQARHSLQDIEKLVAVLSRFVNVI